MAARIRKQWHDQEAREKIRTSQLLNRLQNHILGKIDMSPSQVNATLGLLRKTLPDLSAVDMNVKGQLEAHLVDFVASLGNRQHADTGGQAPVDQAEPDSDTVH